MQENYLQYVDAIQKALQSDTKLNKIKIEKIALSFSIDNKNLVKELTELAIVRQARIISNIDVPENMKNSEYHIFFNILELYKNQANLSHRTSQSMLLQQYSTPAPISYITSLYVKSQNKKAIYFEPSAGNGLLTIALPYENTIVNEIDDVRLENLKSQPYRKITNQDATLPFIDYYKKFDGVVTNPPFGTLDKAVMYDGFPIKTLDHLMTLRALDTMKDSGKAAIIIGGHTSWDDKNRIQAGKNRIFFNYLYSHYNVEDVILIDGQKLYSKQGTSFNVRLILINGRKPKPTEFAPLKNEILSDVVNDFEDLWERVFGNNKPKVDNPENSKRIRIAKVKAESKLKILQLLETVKDDKKNKSLQGTQLSAKYLLLNSYKVSDCSDFVDIAATIEEILINCSIFNVSFFDYPSVYNRIKGLSKLFYSSPKFRKPEHIEYAKKTFSYFTDIMIYIEILGKECDLKGISDINKEFNENLKLFKMNKLGKFFRFILGSPSNKLLKSEFKNANIFLTSATLSEKIKQHDEIDIDNLVNLPIYLNNPILVLKSKTVQNAKVVLTEIKSNKNNNLIIAIHINQNKDGSFIQEIQSIYGKEINPICNWIVDDNLLIWADLEKTKNLFLYSGSNCPKSEQVLNIVTKIQNKNGKSS